MKKKSSIREKANFTKRLTPTSLRFHNKFLKDNSMKQISLNQAIEFITANFSAVSILKTWSTKTTTEVLFQADGVTYELLSNLDAIFNSNNPFVIYEA